MKGILFCKDILKRVIAHASDVFKSFDRRLERNRVDPSGGFLVNQSPCPNQPDQRFTMSFIEMHRCLQMPETRNDSFVLPFEYPTTHLSTSLFLDVRWSALYHNLQELSRLFHDDGLHSQPPERGQRLFNQPSQNPYSCLFNLFPYFLHFIFALGLTGCVF